MRRWILTGAAWGVPDGIRERRQTAGLRQAPELAGSGADHRRLEARCGGKVEARSLAGLDESALHACGLSRQKRAGMKDLSARVLDGRRKPGQLWRLDDEAVRESGTSVRGLGPWSAEIFLMFGLGRPDLLPTDDLGLQAGFRAHLQSRGKITPERMESVARPWRPWRTLACLYLWALLDNPPTNRESR